MIPRAELPRSSFNRSFSHKTTFDAGKLIPIFCEEVLPGDSFNTDVNLFCRLSSPLSVPIMDDMFIDFHFWFVPNRLVWDNWEKLNGERKNPTDSTDYLAPVLPNSKFASGSLGDYFGIPNVSTGIDVNVLPFRAYWTIWNEWYRDQNLQVSAPVSMGDASGVWTSNTAINGNMSPWNPAPRGKRHDYFTSCLPWPQKGPGVELPLGDTAPVIGNGVTLGLTNGSNSFATTLGDSGAMYATTAGYGTPVGSSTSGITGTADKTLGLTTDPTKSGLVADLSNATAATINSLRQAFQLQRLFERDARGGTRYTEVLRAHFGVVSPDARLQRPEYLGGFSEPITINPVAQTSATDSTSPQANLSAFGLVGGSRHGFTKSFVEHGFIIGLCSVRANLTYQQGLHRMWSRRSRFDYYWPALAHLGEQAVLNKEIYVQGTSADDEVFGYQERWAEYRYADNRISGKFRSTADGTLDVWHLSQKFDNLPALNSEFIAENPPISRVVAVTDEPHFLADFYFKQKVARVMPTYSVPGLMDHF